MASIFSKIVKGEIPSYKVAEDEYYYAFLTESVDSQFYVYV